MAGSSPNGFAPARDGLPRRVEQVLGLAGLAASMPVLLAAGAAITLTSPGPALFRQKRIGRFGDPFTLYKLRTMRQDNSGPGFTSSTDNRITPVGRILRKTKLDELPELWNVVKGDLSLVGPRPEVDRYIDYTDPNWKQVLESRPGLTHPVTLKLRNEEELLAQAPGDPTDYYVKTLLPYKLSGYLKYQRERTWQSDVQVLVKTALVILLPQLAPPPTSQEIAQGTAV